VIKVARADFVTLPLRAPECSGFASFVGDACG
jgi:hypothetical protein